MCSRLLLLSVFASATTAYADPTFHTTDRQGSESSIGVAFSHVAVDADGETAQRLEAYGQYIAAPELGIGGYAIASGVRGASDSDDTTHTLGNVELGGVLAHPCAALRGIVRAGAVFATAGDAVDQRFANNLAGYARITDAAHVTGNVTWLRASASARPRTKNAFYRVDVGLDVPDPRRWSRRCSNVSARQRRCRTHRRCGSPERRARIDDCTRRRPRRARPRDPHTGVRRQLSRCASVSSVVDAGRTDRWRGC